MQYDPATDKNLRWLTKMEIKLSLTYVWSWYITLRACGTSRSVPDSIWHPHLGAAQQLPEPEGSVLLLSVSLWRLSYIMAGHLNERHPNTHILNTNSGVNGNLFWLSGSVWWAIRTLTFQMHSQFPHRGLRARRTSYVQRYWIWFQHKLFPSSPFVSRCSSFLTLKAAGLLTVRAPLLSRQVPFKPEQ